MSKRAPTTALTHDNWDQEYKEEEAGSFKRANQSTLKERVIMKAKRKNLTSNGGSTATSAFAGFGAKFAAKSPEKQPESPKILAEPKEADTITEEKTIEDTSNADNEVKNLNLALLKWIQKHLDESPVCDLRPIFQDYDGHMTRIDKKYGTSWTDSDSQSVKDENEAPNTESLFETKQVESPLKVDSPVKMDPKPFSFMSKKSDDDVKSAPSSTPLFSFKPKSPKKDENSDSKSTTPKFSFNPTKPENGESKVPTFSFSAKKDDTKDEKSDDKPAGGFFSKLNNSNSEESSSKPAFGGFSFGSSNGSNSTSGFTFGSGGGLPPFKPMSESKTEAEGEYEPPKVEDKEFDDAKDALYQKKAKIFYSKEGSYKEIGVGQLFVKPLEDNKASILVRADNTLGNILLNILIPKAPKVTSVGKNNCLITAVPNPAIEGVEGCVPILMRVKTGEDRDELLKVIESKQE